MLHVFAGPEAAQTRDPGENFPAGPPFVVQI